MSNITKLLENSQKKLAVTKHLLDTAEELGAQFHANSDNVSKHIAEVMALMVSASDPEEIKDFVSALISACKVAFPEIELWTYLCLNVNWLSWAWHNQGEAALSEAWADQWYRIDEFSLDTLKGSDLDYYIKARD